MGNRKYIFLFFSLLLPVLLYIFLAGWGRNSYHLPVYHEKGAEATPCLDATSGQFMISPAIWETLALDQAPALVVFGNESGLLMALPSMPGCQLLEIDTLKDTRQREMPCHFRLTASDNAVLVDDERRIRGYYSLSLQEERDRLELEWVILEQEDEQEDD